MLQGWAQSQGHIQGQDGFRVGVSVRVKVRVGFGVRIRVGLGSLLELGLGLRSGLVSWSGLGLRSSWGWV